MKNRAKCKLCNEILESFYRHDYITCKCGEISIDGGNDYCRAMAKNWENFLRIDDEGNEIVVTIQEPVVKEPVTPDSTPNKKELINMLDEMIKSIDNLPTHAMISAVTQYDMQALMMLLSSIFKEKND